MKLLQFLTNSDQNHNVVPSEQIVSKEVLGSIIGTLL